MRQQVPTGVFIAVIAAAVVIAGVLLWPKIAGGPQIMDARGGPPAQLKPVSDPNNPKGPTSSPLDPRNGMKGAGHSGAPSGYSGPPPAGR